MRRVSRGPRRTNRARRREAARLAQQQRLSGGAALVLGRRHVGGSGVAVARRRVEAVPLELGEQAASRCLGRVHPSLALTQAAPQALTQPLALTQAAPQAGLWHPN